MATKATAEIEEAYVPGGEMAVPDMGQRRHPKRSSRATRNPLRESDLRVMVTGKLRPGRIRSFLHLG